jgi:hypothetical protein
MILGMSVAGLLEFQGGLMDFVKAFHQLLHEYEYYSTREPGSQSGKPKMVHPFHHDRLFGREISLNL